VKERNFHTFPSQLIALETRSLKTQEMLMEKSFQLSSDALSLSSAGIFFENWNRTRVQH
jgi:hypothetical protein